MFGTSYYNYFKTVARNLTGTSGRTTNCPRSQELTPRKVHPGGSKAYRMAIKGPQNAYYKWFGSEAEALIKRMDSNRMKEKVGFIDCTESRVIYYLPFLM